MVARLLVMITKRAIIFMIALMKLTSLLLTSKGNVIITQKAGGY